MKPKLVFTLCRLGQPRKKQHDLIGQFSNVLIVFFAEFQRERERDGQRTSSSSFFYLNSIQLQFACALYPLYDLNKVFVAKYEVSVMNVKHFAKIGCDIAGYAFSGQY